MIVFATVSPSAWASTAIAAPAKSTSFSTREICGRQAKAMGARGARHHQMQSGGAVGQRIERLCIGGFGVRMFDPRHHLPGAMFSAQRTRSRLGGALHQRAKGNAIGRMRDQFVERLALENLVDERAPLAFAGTGEGQRTARRWSLSGSSS